MHLIVLIFGFTGVLGALISIPSTHIVWHRMAIAWVVLLFYVSFSRWSVFPGQTPVLKFIFTGFVIAAHWVAFFEAIKVSNVSVTLATMSSATLFTALLEPLFFRRSVQWYEVLLGGMMIGGLVMIFNFEPNYQLGIVIALGAAFSAALFTVLNGIFIRDHAPGSISLYEVMGGVIGISIYLLMTKEVGWSFFLMSWENAFYLLLLGSICTAFAFVGSVKVMRSLSPFTVALTVNLEPVYGILLAFLIFGESEKMGLGFYSGALIILVAIFTNAWIKKAGRSKKLDT